MKLLLKIFIGAVSLLPFIMEAQEDTHEGSTVMDSLYREDQLYLGFSYNILTDLPDDISAAGFSGGFEFGFIRDLPVNQRRNWALGAGIGWSYNNYGSNLFIGEDPNTDNSNFVAIDDVVVDYDKNRLSMQSVDIPLQLRWRTSTIESYRFWRIYAGVKFGYAYYVRSNFEEPGNTVRQTDIPELNRFRAGATFSFGYNTFNFHFYYSLNPLFREGANLDGESLEFRTFQVGLTFYLL